MALNSIRSVSGAFAYAERSLRKAHWRAPPLEAESAPHPCPAPHHRVATLRCHITCSVVRCCVQLAGELGRKVAQSAHGASLSMGSCMSGPEACGIEDAVKPGAFRISVTLSTGMVLVS
jgi:hypothetical protein